MLPMLYKEGKDDAGLFRFRLLKGITISYSDIDCAYNNRAVVMGFHILLLF